jgi:hypothetical protein
MGRKQWGPRRRSCVAAFVFGNLTLCGNASAQPAISPAPTDVAESRDQPQSANPKPSGSNPSLAQPSQDGSFRAAERSIYMPEDTTAHNHDGFLFEGSIGGVVLLAGVDDPVTGDARITASGLGFGFAIGGTPFRGLALGLCGSATAIVERDFDRETPRASGAEQSVGFMSYTIACLSAQASALEPACKCG